MTNDIFGKIDSYNKSDRDSVVFVYNEKVYKKTQLLNICSVLYATRWVVLILAAILFSLLLKNFLVYMLVCFICELIYKYLLLLIFNLNLHEIETQYND